MIKYRKKKKYFRGCICAAALSAAVLMTACGNAGTAAQSSAAAGTAGADSGTAAAAEQGALEEAKADAAADGAEKEQQAENAAGSIAAQETAPAAAEGSAGSTDAAASAEPVLTEFDDLFRSFELKDVDGNPVTQDVFKDHDLTLVNIWATFCGPCLQEMPDLGKLNQEYQEAGKSFQIVGLVADGFSVEDNGKLIQRDEEMVEKAKELIAQTGADYLHIVPDGSFAYSLLMSGEAQSVPTSVFVDSEGNIVGRTVMGARAADNWRTIIDERLAEVSGS